MIGEAEKPEFGPHRQLPPRCLVKTSAMAWLVSGTTPKFENTTEQVMLVTMLLTVVVPGMPLQEEPTLVLVVTWPLIRSVLTVTV